MEKFLSTSKKQLENVNQFTKIHAVLGNEACDLDSAVSAIVTAYLLHHLQPISSVLVLAVLNIPRKDIRLRTEITYFFEEVEIPLDSLVYRDEIDLKKLHSENKLSLTLVDHNLLPKEDAELQSAVQEIIDHHRLENSQRCEKTVEMVGSCCTLVAEKMINTRSDLIDPQIALLLYGTILLDTVCLSDSAKRATPKDKMIVSKLQAIIPEMTPSEVYRSLLDAKTNISGLTLDELLRKDLKTVGSNSQQIAISSIPGELKDLNYENNMETEFSTFCKNYGYHALVILTVKVDEKSNNVTRQLAVFSYDTSFRHQITSALLSVGEPSLQLQVLEFGTDNFIAFLQENSQASRKVILPIIKKFLNSSDEKIPSEKEDAPVKNSTISHPLQDCLNSPEDVSVRTTVGENSLHDSSNSASETAKDSGTEKGDEDTSVIAESLTENLKGYQAETVDFPESPQHFKLRQQRRMIYSGEDDIDEDTYSRGDTFSMSESRRGERPSSLSGGHRLRRKIKVNPEILQTDMGCDDDQRSLSSLSNKSDADVSSPVDDLLTPDDIDTPDEMDDSVLERTESVFSEPIPELSAVEEFDEERSWKSCHIGGSERKIDMKVIEPYKKVLSHGGYFGSERHAIIVFSACFLPDRSRRDYDYVMDNLFLYVLTTLDQLVAEDYVLIYLHGATQRSNMPSFGWLKRCYQMIDRRLRKNLKRLYLVHPTFWLKTIVVMTKPFISSKFSRKLSFVNSLQELSELIPMDHVIIPDKVKQLEFEIMIKEKKKNLKNKKIVPGPTYRQPWAHSIE